MRKYFFISLSIVACIALTSCKYKLIITAIQKASKPATKSAGKNSDEVLKELRKYNEVLKELRKYNDEEFKELLKIRKAEEKEAFEKLERNRGNNEIAFEEFVEKSKKNDKRAIEETSEDFDLPTKIATRYLIYQRKSDSVMISDLTETIRQEPKLLPLLPAEEFAAIWRNPNDANAYYRRGYMYAKKGDYDRAISDYSEAVKLDSNFAWAYFNRGNAYADKGDYNRAIADYESTLRINPNHSDARKILENIKKMER